MGDGGGMSAPRHTPGPWAIGTETRGDEICTIHGVARQPTEDGKGQGWVYVHYPHTIEGDWHLASEDEKLANAYLIAAAPELLAALNALISKSTDIEGDWSEEWRAAIRAVEKAQITRNV